MTLYLGCPSITVMSSARLIERVSVRTVLIQALTYTSTFSILMCLIGCGKPFNVKEPNLPPAGYAGKTSVGKVDVQAEAITDEDFLYYSFDANLIAAGVLPVRVMLTNSGNQDVGLQKARFEIRPPQGRATAAVDARQAFKRLISYYEIKAYNKSGYKKSLEAFSSYALDVKSPLAGGQSRQGLVFFLTSSESARVVGLTLLITRLSSAESREAIELKLN